MYVVRGGMVHSAIESYDDSDVKPPPFEVVVLFNLIDDPNPVDVDQAGGTPVQQMRRGLRDLGYNVHVAAVANDVAGALKDFDPDRHIVFNWCEGLWDDPNAFDAIPPVLEQHGFVYTGADSWSLAATQDKARTKCELVNSAVSTPESHVFDSPQLNGWDRFPAFVKPAAEHSSHGISKESIVDTPQDLQQRIEYVLDNFEGPALVEDFIDGPEFNVSLWGNGTLKMLPLTMMDYSMFGDYHDRLCSYDAKWDPEADIYHFATVQCPAPVAPELYARIAETARGAYQALRMRDYGRIDIRVRDGQPYVLDVNPNPDISRDAGFCRSARVAGYDYGRAIAQVLKFAAERHPKLKTK
ncbi:MAG: ATP-grasp domain-containing protein [Anaerolineales bacterium]